MHEITFHEASPTDNWATRPADNDHIVSRAVAPSAPGRVLAQGRDG